MKRSLSVLALSGVLLSLAAPAFAASSSSTGLKSDVLKNLTITTSATPAMPQGPMMGANAGGGMMAAPEAMMKIDGSATRSSIFLPPYQQGGVTVDVNITKTITPDVIILNSWCSIDGTSRDAVRAQSTALYKEIVSKVGRDGRVRRSGFSVNPMYDMTGKPTTSFNGSLNFMIRFTKPAAASAIADWLESKDCSSNWDVRLLDMQAYEMKIIDELITKLADRKQVFEKLLGKTLKDVQSAYLSSYVDGYASYDPDTNTADINTTLSVTFAVPGVMKPVNIPLPMTK